MAAVVGQHPAITVTTHGFRIGKVVRFFRRAGAQRPGSVPEGRSAATGECSGGQERSDRGVFRRAGAQRPGRADPKFDTDVPESPPLPRSALRLSSYKLGRRESSREVEVRAQVTVELAPRSTEPMASRSPTTPAHPR